MLISTEPALLLLVDEDELLEEVELEDEEEELDVEAWLAVQVYVPLMTLELLSDLNASQLTSPVDSIVNPPLTSARAGKEKLIVMSVIGYVQIECWNSRLTCQKHRQGRLHHQCPSRVGIHQR